MKASERHGRRGCVRGAIGTRVAAVVWLAAGAAFGVIKVEFPVSRMFTDSRQVCVGVVTESNAEMMLVTVRVDAVPKGTFPHKTVRVQLAQPEGVAARAGVGSPVVLFLGESDGKPIAILHAGDTWLLANGIAGASPPAWRTAQVYDAAKSYPGRTSGVVRLVEALKDGRRVLDDLVDPEGFAGKGKEAANLGSPPAFLVAADVNSDGRLDLVVGTEKGVRVLAGSAQGYADATAGSGIEEAKALACATGDVNGDGKVDLLLGKTVWVGNGGNFRRLADAGAELPVETWMAGTIGDVTGDGKADVVVAAKSGELSVLENPGRPDGAWTLSRTNLWQEGGDASAAVFSGQWGDDGEMCLLAVRGDGVFRYGVSRKGGHADDFARLTGVPLASCRGLTERPIRAIAVAAWDADGNRKTDFLAIAPTGGLTLMNRGLGAFLVENGIHEKVRSFVVEGRKQPFTSGCFLAAGPSKPTRKWRQSLFLACPDGRVFELE